MTIISYKFADGHYEEIEVTEDFAREYEKLEISERRRQWREHKHGDVSLERLMEKGLEFADINSKSPEEILFDTKNGDLDFHAYLTDYQYKVADMRFNKHMTHLKIATALGVSTAAVSRILKKAVKKIYREFFDCKVKL